MRRTGNILIRVAISGLALWVAEDASYKGNANCCKIPVPFAANGQRIVNETGRTASSDHGKISKHAWSHDEKFARLFKGQAAPLSKRNVGDSVVPVQRIGVFLPAPAPLSVHTATVAPQIFAPVLEDTLFSYQVAPYKSLLADLLLTSPLRGPPECSVS